MAFNKKNFIVEGNIGSGKTTLVSMLSENPEYEVIKEPVDTWLSIKDDQGKNLLQVFYEDIPRYSYLFQTMVFKTRLQSIDHEQIKPVRFCERSIWTDKYVFGRACIENKSMNSIEANSYNYWFDWLEEKFKPQANGIIYLRCSPEKCMERIMKRGRSEESHIPKAYLEQLHDYHEDWVIDWISGSKETDLSDNSRNSISNSEEKIPILVIDNEIDNNWSSIMDQVNEFIKKV